MQSTGVVVRCGDFDLVRGVAQKIGDLRLRNAMNNLLDDHERISYELDSAKRRIWDLEMMLLAVRREKHPERIVKMYQPKKRTK